MDDEVMKSYPRDWVEARGREIDELRHSLAVALIALRQGTAAGYLALSDLDDVGTERLAAMEAVLKDMEIDLRELARRHPGLIEE